VSGGSGGEEAALKKMAQNNRQYRLVLIHPDGSVQVGEMYNSKEGLDDAMRNVPRTVGVRYRCQEWTVGTATPECRDPLVEMMVEYDI
jgi:hypothetical protein